jgi:copper chaperone CopZ
MNVQYLKVAGMHCASCEMLLKDELSEIENVKTVDSDHKTGTVTIGHEGSLDMGKVNAAITELGFNIIG